MDIPGLSGGWEADGPHWSLWSITQSWFLCYDPYQSTMPRGTGIGHYPEILAKLRMTSMPSFLVQSSEFLYSTSWSARVHITIKPSLSILYLILRATLATASKKRFRVFLRQRTPILKSKKLVTTIDKDPTLTKRNIIVTVPPISSLDRCQQLAQDNTCPIRCLGLDPRLNQESVYNT